MIGRRRLNIGVIEESHFVDLEMIIGQLAPYIPTTLRDSLGSPLFFKLKLVFSIIQLTTLNEIWKCRMKTAVSP